MLPVKLDCCISRSRALRRRDDLRLRHPRGVLDGETIDGPSGRHKRVSETRLQHKYFCGMYACNIYAKYIMQILFFSFKIVLLGYFWVTFILFFLLLRGVYSSIICQSRWYKKFLSAKWGQLIYFIRQNKMVMVTVQFQLLLVSRSSFASVRPSFYLYIYMGQGSLVTVHMGLEPATQINN